MCISFSEARAEVGRTVLGGQEQKERMGAPVSSSVVVRRAVSRS